MKKIALGFIILFVGFFIRSPWAHAAAITLNATSSAFAGASSNTTVTSSITISAGTNMVLYANVGYYTAAAGVTSTASFNGVPMTLLTSSTKANGTDVYDAVYYLVNPPTGTNVASSTVSSAAKAMTIHLNAYNNVNQSTPFGAATTTSQTTNPAESASITTLAVNSWILDGATFGYTTSTTTTYTQGGSQTLLTQNTTPQASAAFAIGSVTSRKTGTTIQSYTMTETSVSSANLPASAMVVVELEAAPPVATTSDAIFFAGD